MTLYVFSSGVNTSFSSQLNLLIADALAQAGIASIQALQVGAGTNSVGAVGGFGEAYIDATGRVDSVQVGSSTTAYFNSTSLTYNTGVADAYRRFKFNETSGTTLTDSGLSSSSATKEAAVTINVAGKLDKCISIASGNQTLPYTANSQPSTSDNYTICGWVKTTSHAGYGGGSTIIRNNDGTNPAGLQLNINVSSTNQVLMVASKAGVGSDTATWGSTISTGTWYFVVGTFNNGTTQISINVNQGTAVTASYTRGVQSAIAAANGGWELVAPDANAVYFDDFRVYNRILSAAELNSIYNSGTGSESAVTGVQTVEITQAIPTGTFASNISKAVGVPLLSAYEAGGSTEFSLSNASSTSGWIQSNTPIITSFTAFASEPTYLKVRITPKSSSPTAETPALKGFWVRATP